MADLNPKNNKYHIHIGMRKIKSLLAIVIGFFIWQAIRLALPDLEVHPVFIYIYGLLEIRDTSEKTKSFGVQRIKATLIAMAVGLPMLILRIYLHNRLESAALETALDLAMILIGSLVTLMIGEKVGCGALTGLVPVIYIILLVYHTDDNRYVYALLRALQTVIGVFVAWLLNVILFPYPGKKTNKE